MHYLDDLPDNPKRTLGLQCLRRCQDLTPHCGHCPKDAIPIEVVNKRMLRFAIMLSLITLITLLIAI